MELLLQQLADISREIVHFAWLPVLVWTIIAAVVIGFLKAARTMHVQYHYHFRLALIVGLPLGLFSTWFVEYLSALLTSMGAEAVNLKVIAVLAPLETGITASEASAGLTMIDVLYLAVIVVIAVGVLFFLCSRISQWIHLNIIRKRYHLTDAECFNEISEYNIDLAEQTGKRIFIGISESNIIPVTFGIRQPVILIPECLLSEPEKMNLAIRHEITHISNSDFTTHLSTVAIQSLFWFHPLVHLLVNQLIEYREMRCDSIIIADSSVSKKQYASLLFELLPMPNLNQQISVNMAQQSSNLKERIERISHQQDGSTFPSRSRLTVLGTLLLCLSVAMACTDFQTQAVFDEEELNLMTDPDLSGERGYHQVLIFFGEDGQSERHENAIAQLNRLKPEHVESVEIIDGDAATEEYGSRAEKGMVVIRTKPDPDSYNLTLKALGMEADESLDASDQQDYFVVVEEMPELIGGLASIQKEIRYPETARRAGIEGRVYVQFIVNENGQVENPRIIRGLGGGLDEEAIRAVKHAEFKPGIQRGQPVRVQYALPIVFRLMGNDNDSDGATSSNDLDIEPGTMVVSGYSGTRERTQIEAATLTGSSIDRLSNPPTRLQPINN